MLSKSFTLIILTLICSTFAASSITNNIPVVVSPYKNYTSSEPTWLTSPFFRAGNERVIKELTGNDKTPTYTFTYSSALPGRPNLAYGIKNYKGNDWFGQEFYQIKQIGLTPTTFSVSIQIYGVTNLWILTVAYLAMDPTFPHHLNTFENVPINYTAGDIVNITDKQYYLTYYQNYINYTAQADNYVYKTFSKPFSEIYIVLYMTSLWIRADFRTSTYVNPIQFHVYTGIVNESFYYWNVTLRERTLITNVHFSQIIFDSGDVESSKKYFIIYSTWINDIDGGFLQIPQAFVDNFIMGVTAFQTVEGQCGFDYNWQFTTKQVNGVLKFGVELQRSWTLTNTCGFSWSQSSVFYMQTWLCQDPYLYFNLTSGLCQTLCGGFNYEQLTGSQYTCQPCVNTLCYQCDQPDKNLCTDCASYQHYELVDGTCTCMAGYFPAANKCMDCWQGSVGCEFCTYNDGASGTLAYNSAKFACTECNNTLNYFLTGTRCTLCTLFKCQFCLNLTACTTCISPYRQSITLTCVICNVVGCAYCSASNPNICAECNATIGYYLQGSTCVSKCGDGIIVSATEGCDDNNTLNYDGCSATCIIQSYFSCSNAPSQCFFKQIVTITHIDTIVQTEVCDTVTFTFQLFPPSVTYAQPNIVWDNFLVSPNSSIIIQNNSMFKYSQGKLKASYFLLATIQDQTIDFTTNYSSLINGSSIFAKTIDASTSFIVTPSNGLPAELVCCIGYYLNVTQKKCLQICGDSMLFILPCDDGNINNNDGCDSKCQIQKDYICFNGTETTPSICSFNGTIQMEVQSGNKDPDSNSITISYSVSPILPLINLVGGNDFLPFVTLNNPAATITSAVYNPATKLIQIQVSYNQTIQGEPLSLSFNPPNVPQASLLQPVSNTWVVVPTNRLSATFYSSQTYEKLNSLKPFSQACVGTYLGLIAVSMFFRKFIGLQLAVLIQMGYLSLLSNEQIPAYLQPILTWKYIFGYNDFIVGDAARPLPIDQPYTIYGYQRYFGYSNNLMILAIVSTYGMSILLFLFSGITSKSFSRRLKAGGMILINQLAYALTVFSTPNIIIAIAIEINQNTITDTSIFWSKAFLVCGVLAIVIGNIVNFINIEQTNQIGTFFRKHSGLGIYASVFFTIRLIIISIFIYLYPLLGNYSHFTILFVQLGYIVYSAFGRPHKKPFDLFRSMFIEISLLIVLFSRFLYSYFLNILLNQSDIIFDILSLTELAAYGTSITLSIASLIYHLIKKFKKTKISPDEGDNEERSPQKMPNDSISKLDNPSKELIGDSPSKRKMMENNSFVFDMEEVDGDTFASGGGKTQISLDVKRQGKKLNRRRR